MATRRPRPRSAKPAPLKHPPQGPLAAHYRRVLDIAMTLPGVEDTRAYGTPCIKVDGKVMARLRSEAEGGLALRCDFPERHMLMQADPRVFYVTDHYVNWPMVLDESRRSAVGCDARSHRSGVAARGIADGASTSTQPRGRMASLPFARCTRRQPNSRAACRPAAELGPRTGAGRLTHAPLRQWRARRRSTRVDERVVRRIDRRVWFQNSTSVNGQFCVTRPFSFLYQVGTFAAPHAIVQVAFVDLLVVRIVDVLLRHRAPRDRARAAAECSPARSAPRIPRRTRCCR